MIKAINESSGTHVSIEGRYNDIEYEFISIVASLIRDFDHASVRQWVSYGENLANNPEWVEELNYGHTFSRR